jgi:hypothetical protein
LATGYYLGARAGRQRYDQINRQLTKLRNSEAFDEAAERAKAVVTEGVEKARSIVDKGADNLDTLDERADTGADNAGDNGSASPSTTGSNGATLTATTELLLPGEPPAVPPVEVILPPTPEAPTAAEGGLGPEGYSSSR